MLFRRHARYFEFSLSPAHDAAWPLILLITAFDSLRPAFADIAADALRHSCHFMLMLIIFADFAHFFDTDAAFAAADC